MSKPYYEDAKAGIAIYHGDCREILPTLEAVDLVIADPPYEETNLKWDLQVRGWMDACEPRTNSIWCFGSLQFFMELARLGECSRWTRSQEVVWEKHNGSGSHTDRFRRVHEIVAHFYRGPWSDVYKRPQFTNDALAKTVRRTQKPGHWGEINVSRYRSEDGGPRMMRSVIHCRSAHGDAEHPTQKPIGVIMPLLEYGCPKSGSVIDPFSGSGSVLVAAKLSGRNAIGIELEEKYAEIAARRLQQEILPFSNGDSDKPYTSQQSDLLLKPVENLQD
jgi:site-specific DNA-methyltransferase (adenine-specific)